MDDLKGFGVRLRSLIRQRHQTQSAVAQAIGVTPQAVSKWGRGGAIDEANLKKLAEHLEANWLWLRYGEAILDKHLPISSRSQPPLPTPSLEKREPNRRGITEMIENYQRINFMLSAMRIGVWEVNLLTGEQYWSPIFRDHLGVPYNTAPSFETLKSILQPRDLDSLHELIHNCHPADPPVAFELHLRDSAKPNLSVIHACMPDHTDVPARVVAFVRNLSDARQPSFIWRVNS